MLVAYIEAPDLNLKTNPIHYIIILSEYILHLPLLTVSQSDPLYCMLTTLNTCQIGKGQLELDNAMWPVVSQAALASTCYQKWRYRIITMRKSRLIPDNMHSKIDVYTYVNHFSTIFPNKLKMIRFHQIMHMATSTHTHSFLGRLVPMVLLHRHIDEYGHLFKRHGEL